MATTITSSPTLSSRSLPRAGWAPRRSLLPSNVQVPSPLPGPTTLPSAGPAEPVMTVRSRKSERVERRGSPAYPGSAEALSLLTLHPVFATPVPRHHIEPRAPDGTRWVHDRATSEQFAVYSPRFVIQFRAGHRSGLWYLRPATDLGITPRSVGFRTRLAAVEALRAGGWMPGRSIPECERRRRPCRIIWS
jgi:hypothetical protein